MILATLLHPDAAPKEVAAFHSKRGQWAKGDKGGRPVVNRPGYKKARRLEKMPDVERRFREGWSPHKIAAAVGIPEPTIRDWIKINRHVWGV